VTSNRFVTFLVLGALALAGLVLAKPWSRAPRAPALAPLAVIPPGPAFVLDIDLARLRENATGAELSTLGLRRFVPSSSSAAFRPFFDVDKIVFSVAGDARIASAGAASPFEPNAVAVVASGRFTGNAAADTAAERIRARGGKPVRTRLGSFESVRDLEAGGEVAARDGLVVLSDGGYLRAVLNAAEGQRSDGSETERTRDRVHAELRRTFGRDAPVAATLVLPQGWLEAALGDEEVDRSPLSLVRAAALRLNVTHTVEIDALLVAANAQDGARIAAFVTAARADLERVLGRIGALSRVRQKQEGPRVELSLSLTPHEIEELLAPRDGGP
jgi:hypothetical protein